jgi:Helix-turn-helix domain
VRLRCASKLQFFFVPARRKLDQAAVEQIMAGKAADHSDRQIAARLGVSHTTVSRRVHSDPELRARIKAAEQRKARLRPAGGRSPARAAGGEQSRPPGVPAAQPRFNGPAQGIEREMWDRATQIAQTYPAAAVATPAAAAPPVDQHQPPPVAAAAQSTPGSLRVLGFTSELERYAYYEERSLISEKHLLDWHDVRAGRLTPAEKRTLHARQ